MRVTQTLAINEIKTKRDRKKKASKNSAYQNSQQATFPNDKNFITGNSQDKYINNNSHICCNNNNINNYSHDNKGI